jgi:chaperonin GroES
MVDAGRDIGNLKEVLEGETSKEMTATTTMALIEQGLKVFSGIYKRIYRSLTAKSLGSSGFGTTRFGTLCTQKFWIKASPMRISVMTILDFVPVADPAVVTDLQKAARVDFMKEWVNDPYFDQWKLRERIWEGANMEGIDELQAGQNPEVKKLQEQMQQMQQVLQQLQGELEDKTHEQKMDVLKLEGDQNVQRFVAKEKDASAIEKIAKAESARRRFANKSIQVRNGVIRWKERNGKRG